MADWKHEDPELEDRDEDAGINDNEKRFLSDGIIVSYRIWIFFGYCHHEYLPIGLERLIPGFALL